ncbi:MBL fold metallo-hydrolase [Vibrio sp.]|nr:MBL fold metallo-hydrolase [Vibrio sp.]
MDFKVIHHGGKDTVTGSCHELQLFDSTSLYSSATKASLLIDCGLFQGKDLYIRGKESSERSLECDFAIKHINALVLTHAHIDHIGRLPWLLAAGFKGPILCTPATAELVPIMLDDGLKLQLGLNKGQRQRVLDLIKKRIKTVDYHQWHRIRLGQSYVYIRFNPAGHILGSAYVECKLPNNEIIVFSGDLGPNDTPLLPDPTPPKRADYVFIETTYGNKVHESIADRRLRLGSIIQRSIQDGGTIIIPAFSVGRTQELLFDIEQLIYEKGISDQLPIIVDSPMAKAVTKSYRKYRKLWSKESKDKRQQGRHPLGFDQRIVVKDYKEHLRVVNRLASTGEPAIVIAASGMCQGGRVMGYLEALLSDERTDVIFAGYQAQGTLGRELQKGAELQHDNRQVTIGKKRVSVKAQVHTMSGYSAHADKKDLMQFMKGISSPIKEVHLIHGEPKVKSEFAKDLRVLEGVELVVE